MARSERTRRIETLVREHQELAVREFERVLRKLEGLEKQVCILQRIVADGEQMEFPWSHIKGDTSGHKCRQVEKALEYLKAHRTARIPKAVEATFTPDPLGYTKADGLLSYCYRIRLDGYR